MHFGLTKETLQKDEQRNKEFGKSKKNWFSRSKTNYLHFLLN